MGAKDRETNQVAATVIQSTDAETLQGFVKDHADRQATVYTDDATAYESLPFDHDTVKHSLSEYVKGDVTNGIESLWSLLAHTGTFHKLTLTAIRSSPDATTCVLGTIHQIKGLEGRSTRLEVRCQSGGVVTPFTGDNLAKGCKQQGIISRH